MLCVLPAAMRNCMSSVGARQFHILLAVARGCGGQLLENRDVVHESARLLQTRQAGARRHLLVPRRETRCQADLEGRTCPGRLRPLVDRGQAGAAGLDVRRLQGQPGSGLTATKRGVGGAHPPGAPIADGHRGGLRHHVQGADCHCCGQRRGGPKQSWGVSLLPSVLRFAELHGCSEPNFAPAVAAVRFV
jgi:hypothetical protein